MGYRAGNPNRSNRQGVSKSDSAVAYWCPVVPGVTNLPYPADCIMVDTDGAQVALECVDGTELVISAGAFTTLQNGTFAAADGWTLGAGWLIGGGYLVHSAAGGTNDAYQSALTVVGQKAAVVFDMVYTSGTSVTAKLGTGAGTPRASSATFIEILTAAGSGNLIFTPTNDLAASIDNVRVYPCTHPLSNRQAYAYSCTKIVAVTPASTVVYAGYYRRPDKA